MISKCFFFTAVLLATSSPFFTTSFTAIPHTIRTETSSDKYQNHDVFNNKLLISGDRKDGSGLAMSAGETLWDRITGPKLFKTVTNWKGIHSVPLVPLRIITGLLMIHHGSEGGVGPANFGTPEFQGFVDFIVKPYFGFLPGSPELWSAVHDYAEFYGAICFTVGFLTRPAALTLLGTMLSAVYFHLSADGLQGFPLGHVANYSYNFEEPALYALIFLMFWFNGAGPLSVDSIIYSAISGNGDDTDEEEA